MIILIRHAQSEGNKNREIHQSVPDHRVKLTAEGHRQSQEAGAKLRDLLRPDDTLHFFTSPYRRTRETTEGLLDSLSSDSPAPSPFPRHTIKVYEEPRLREQDFGNFQPCSAEMERMWLERADYGHFFYRIPNGESAADAYDRVSGFNESLWRLFGEDDFASVCVLVTHGLMTRVFLMKWYHWSVEYFEDLRNINHCEFVILKLNPDNGKYTLQNNMRTWSELKKETEAERQRERAVKGLGPGLPLDAPMPVTRRRWGGCPDGCNHGVRRKSSLRTARANGTDTLRHEHHDTRKPDPSTRDNAQGADQKTEAATPKEPKPKDVTTTTPDDHEHYVSLASLPQPTPKSSSEPNTTNTKPPTSNLAPTNQNQTLTRRPHLFPFPRDSEDHLLHPPNLALLHLVGRDGGGSMSGMNSLAPSEDEREEASRRPMPTSHRQQHQQHHQPRPSQDIANDGDDEGSGKSGRLRRSKVHHAHPHNHNHHHQLHHALSSHSTTLGRRNLAMRTGNTLGDGDRDGDVTDDYTDHVRETSAESEHHQNHHNHSQHQENGQKNGPQKEQPDQHQSQTREHGQKNGDGNGSDGGGGGGGGIDALEAARRKDQSIRGSVY